MPEAQYRIEDVSQAPRGWAVRTHLQGAHRVRIAFPPGRKQKGTGQLVQILHPKTENPKSCKTNPHGLHLSVCTDPDFVHPKNGKAKRNRNVGFGEAALTILANSKRRHNFETSAKSKSDATRKVRELIARGINAWIYEDPVKGWQVVGFDPTKSKRNQNNGAEKIYRDFHGRAPHEVLALQDALVTSGDYSALGDMDELWLSPVKVDDDGKVLDDDGRKVAPAIVFEPKDKVILGVAGSGGQLYFIGGNQELPLDYAEKKGLPIDKRWMSLGAVYAISYKTEKSFNGFKTTTYVHELGEETGERPMLVYDSETKRMFLVGGEYSIAPFDKKMGASPGIVN